MFVSHQGGIERIVASYLSWIPTQVRGETTSRLGASFLSRSLANDAEGVGEGPHPLRRRSEEVTVDLEVENGIGADFDVPDLPVGHQVRRVHPGFFGRCLSGPVQPHHHAHEGENAFRIGFAQKNDIELSVLQIDVRRQTQVAQSDRSSVGDGTGDTGTGDAMLAIQQEFVLCAADFLQSSRRGENVGPLSELALHLRTGILKNFGFHAAADPEHEAAFSRGADIDLSRDEIRPADKIERALEVARQIERAGDEVAGAPGQDEKGDVRSQKSGSDVHDGTIASPYCDAVGALLRRLLRQAGSVPHLVGYPHVPGNLRGPQLLVQFPENGLALTGTRVDDNTQLLGSRMDHGGCGIFVTSFLFCILRLPVISSSSPRIMATALIVDDESDAREMLAFSLVNEGWKVIEAADGISGFETARREAPDIIILDLMMPGMNGMDVFLRLKQRRETASIPVIMLTAKGAPAEREAGLEVGADDYVTKPYSSRELAIRMERLLKQRSKPEENGNILEAGAFRLDRNSLTFYLNGEPVDLTGTEFKLLMILIENPGQDQLRGDLLRRIWGYDERIQTRTLDTHVKRLREKLEPHGNSIETVRGVGYRFRCP